MSHKFTKKDTVLLQDWYYTKEEAMKIARTLKKRYGKDFIFNLERTYRGWVIYEKHR